MEVRFVTRRAVYAVAWWLTDMLLSLYVCLSVSLSLSFCMRRPWYVPGVQAVAGYSEVFDTYTFVTIKGAGHEVLTSSSAQPLCWLVLS